MNFFKILYITVFYFVLISGIFFVAKYYVLGEQSDVELLIKKSLVSGLLGAIILSYLIRRMNSTKNQ